jgi:hypothetical protein
LKKSLGDCAVPSQFAAVKFYHRAAVPGRW